MVWLLKDVIPHQEVTEVTAEVLRDRLDQTLVVVVERKLLVDHTQVETQLLDH